MNAEHLFDARGKPANVARCGKCGRLWDPSYAPVSGGVHGKRRWTPDERYAYAYAKAQKCCAWTCDRCGKPAFAAYQSVCQDCLRADRDAERARLEAERLARAAELPFDPDALVLDDHHVRTLGDYLEWREGCGEDPPEYVWVAVPEPLKLDAAGIVEAATDDLHRSARGRIGDGDVADLQALLDGWAARFPVLSYHESGTHYIRIPRPEKGGAS